MTETLLGISTLTHLGIIRAEGDDAARFLQSQLTQDFGLQTPQQARLAGFLSAKGRMQASFVGIKRSNTDIVLICSRDLLAATLKRLSMFVMRSKVKLSDATANYSLHGLAGHTAWQPDTPQPAPWTAEHHDNDHSTIVHLYPAAGQARALWLAPTGTPAPSAPALSLEQWQWGEVMSAVATLTAPLVDALVPQMLNYESIGGVNFKKGCYPGQEVVARSQFRGAIKRRTYLVQTSAGVTTGDEVFAASDASQPCGIVVQAAAIPSASAGPAQYNALLCLQTHAAQETLHITHTATGNAVSVQLLALPYPLLDDI